MNSEALITINKQFKQLDDIIFDYDIMSSNVPEYKRWHEVIKLIKKFLASKIYPTCCNCCKLIKGEKNSDDRKRISTYESCERYNHKTFDQSRVPDGFRYGCHPDPIEDEAYEYNTFYEECISALSDLRMLIIKNDVEVGKNVNLTEHHESCVAIMNKVTEILNNVRNLQLENSKEGL